MSTWKFQSVKTGFDAALEPEDIYAEKDEIERMAAAIYDVDEDILDEAVGLAILSGEKDVSRKSGTRLRWEHVDPKTQKVYRRRALAASAAMQLDETEFKLIP